MAILAAGIGFGIRGGILANWGADFGFTGAQLGAIGGAGFTGFCFGIIIGGVIVDKIGYGKLVVAAFLFHVLSAFVTFAANKGQAQEVAYNFLYWGTFIFALANGTLEAVANPLVATLFPKNRTHYLNILHASWPAGLVLGGLVGWILGDGMHLSWKLQLALFLVPTVGYGLIFFGQHFPKSEASAKGLSIGEMLEEVGILGGLIVTLLLTLFFQNALSLDTQTSYVLGGILLVVLGIITKQTGQISTERFVILIASTLIAIFIQQGLHLEGNAALTLALALLCGLAFALGSSVGAWLLFILIGTHVLVGAVELGTDGWIQNITGNILTTSQGKILFVYTSLFMFALRFCADFIEKSLKISPIGLLFICASLACIGLNLVSGINTFVGAMLALSVYAFGKTFFWPTMLAVTSDRFPRTGAIAISIMGGCGMMSAGLLGSAGLGYAKDRFAADELQKANPAIYAQYKAATPSKFLFLEPVNGLDGTKLAAVQAVAADKRSPEQKTVGEASIQGDRRTLKADSFIPATMALIYLLLFLYFRVIGGYKTVHIEGVSKEAQAAV
ncbi:MAG: MFS transporter [Verrucomicrobia bacterium]|nr:MFS transporter [Verrucomicrobiota bacterium]